MIYRVNAANYFSVNYFGDEKMAWKQINEYIVFGYICASHLRRTKSKAPLDIEYENRIHSTSKYHGGAALYNEYTSDVRELT